LRRAFALIALLVAAAAADGRPPPTPTRDVDVTYMMVQPDARGGPRVVEERMRWAAATQLLRIDPPTKGIWVVMDARAHRISTVREADHQVLELDSAVTMPGPAPDASFVRRGEASVAGLACTEWQTADVTGESALACITADGVLLRAAAAGRVLLEALTVTYGPLDPAVFGIPGDYRRIAPPAAKP
jgi:hypothetical protein